MNHEELKYWIALKLAEDVGAVLFNRLVETFGSPRHVLHASHKELLAVDRMTAKAARALTEFSNWDAVEREIEGTHESGISIVTAADSCYPSLLRTIYDFPPILYVKGSLTRDDINVAVVGSRRASTYGTFMTDRLSRELAMKGITVVSGMARGIDSAAHKGALSVQGRTIAVLGSGIDVIYPPENKKLFEEISAKGAVISEYPLGTEPKSPHFPSRNRIISGMSYGIVVVEANERSGSPITARLALEQGREVFAVPGSIDAPGSKGTHRLLRDGAKLVENVYDVLEEVIPQIARESRAADEEDTAAEHTPAPAQGIVPGDGASLTVDERAILSCMKGEPIQINGITAAGGYPVDHTLRILLSLELKGYIDQLPGKRFKLK